MATSVEPGPEWLKLQETLTARVQELVEEAAFFNDPAPGAAAISALLHLAEHLLPVLNAQRLPHPSVYMRDGGHLELVVHDVPTSRRLTVEIRNDGASATASLADSRGIVKGPQRVDARQGALATCKEWLSPPKLG